ncbi:hypothetical protein [Chthonomonas calidirosea]|uniref:hypothetical protein n=1 Tax=Chthonomonas calidirosea TaxID=454171 RepID=UPI0006EC583C|nr:hypothetical protein [Chthonomonas calidirosea]CEK16726.1 hypothetical protein CP488_01606 [Chthonomonas calidirosea]
MSGLQRRSLHKRSNYLRWIRQTARLVLFAYLLLAVLGEVTHAYEHQGEWQAAVQQIASEKSSHQPHFSAIEQVQPRPCPLCTWQANNLSPSLSVQRSVTRLNNYPLPPSTYSIAVLLIYPPTTSSRSPPHA